VECFLTPGGFGDVDALKYYAYALPDGSMIYADKAYNDYEIEDLLKEVEHIHLLPMRKKNSKRALSPALAFVQSYHRKRVETAGSLIEQLLPKSIHAITSQGFELKVALFVITSSLNGYRHCQLNAKNLHLCAIRRKLYPIFFFHGSLYFRHLHPVSFPHEEGVCERFFIKLTMPNNLTMPYKGVIPAVQHRAITKQARKTNHIERFNNTLRQRVSRLVRETLSFSKTLANHIGALKYFICHYNLTRRGALPV
jgi:IS1 transposase